MCRSLGPQSQPFLMFKENVRALGGIFAPVFVLSHQRRCRSYLQEHSRSLAQTETHSHAARSFAHLLPFSLSVMAELQYVHTEAKSGQACFGFGTVSHMIMKQHRHKVAAQAFELHSATRMLFKLAAVVSHKLKVKQAAVEKQ